MVGRDIANLVGAEIAALWVPRTVLWRHAKASLLVEKIYQGSVDRIDIANLVGTWSVALWVPGTVLWLYAKALHSVEDICNEAVCWGNADFLL